MSEEVKSFCEFDVPPVSGSFEIRDLRTTTEYIYSYTIAACDTGKSFFVRLKGPDGVTTILEGEVLSRTIV